MAIGATVRATEAVIGACSKFVLCPILAGLPA